MIQKFDRAGLARLKKKNTEFMAQGRTEFGRQLEKWRIFFEENCEDFNEMESRLQNLEIMMETMQISFEKVEAVALNSPVASPVASDRSSKGDPQTESQYDTEVNNIVIEKLS